MDMPCCTVILTDFTASGRRSAPLIPAWASGWCNCSAGQLPNRLCLLEEAVDEGGSLPLNSAHIKSTKAGSPFDRKLHSSLTCARGFNYRTCGWRHSATPTTARCSRPAAAACWSLAGVGLKCTSTVNALLGSPAHANASD